MWCPMLSIPYAGRLWLPWDVGLDCVEVKADWFAATPRASKLAVAVVPLVISQAVICMEHLCISGP